MTREISPEVQGALKLLTPQEVAELFQVNVEWLYDQVKHDKIRHVRLGRTIRFRPLDLQEVSRSGRHRWVGGGRHEPD